MCFLSQRSCEKRNSYKSIALSRDTSLNLLIPALYKFSPGSWSGPQTKKENKETLPSSTTRGMDLVGSCDIIQMERNKRCVTTHQECKEIKLMDKQVGTKTRLRALRTKQRFPLGKEDWKRWVTSKI